MSTNMSADMSAKSFRDYLETVFFKNPEILNHPKGR